MKKIERSDYRVEITPSGGDRERDAAELADYLEEIVKRDVGLVELLFKIRVVHDVRTTCEFCGYNWETEDGTPGGEPACCTRAVDEWKADKQVKDLEAVTDRIAEEPEEAGATRIHAGVVTDAVIRYTAHDAILTQDLYRRIQELDERLS